MAPIAEGVENTNYRVETNSKTFVLTLFERRVDKRDLPFFMALTDHLSAKGLPVPQPIADRSGEVVQTLNDRPAALIEFKEGAPRLEPVDEDCAALGAVLARMHLAVEDFQVGRKNPLDIVGWRRLFTRIADRADEREAGLAAFIDDELRRLESEWPIGLPRGVVHTDLFPDNVLFKDKEITGAIDFYFAAEDAFAYDLAVCVNSWCFTQEQRFRASAAIALLQAYEKLRPLSDAERRAMPFLLRGAALRFLLTRLYDFFHQVKDAVVKVKDPLDYRRIIEFHRNADFTVLFEG